MRVASRIALHVELATRAPARRARRPRPAPLASWRHRGPLAPADNGSPRVGPSHASLITSPPRRLSPRCYARDVNALKAHVKNGRIILDEPTDLPEGTELYLVPAEDSDEMDDEERAELEAAIEEGAEDFERGDFSDAREFAARLLASS